MFLVRTSIFAGKAGAEGQHVWLEEREQCGGAGGLRREIVSIALPLGFLIFKIKDPNEKEIVTLAFEAESSTMSCYFKMASMLVYKNK